MDLFDTKGMHRSNDPDTSVRAAQQIKPVQFTIRQQVEEWAKGMTSGFIDEELLDNWPDRADSTCRARRAELAQENIIIDTGFRRLNSRGREMIVWLHRDHHPAPPPLVEREAPISKAQQVINLNARVHGLELAMRQVQDLLSAQPYSPGISRAMAIIERAL